MLSRVPVCACVCLCVSCSIMAMVAGIMTGIAFQELLPR
jgi:hypothetical protein